nr:MAG TPA: hypothetical protein [Caudoviricetes sp.]
MAVVKSKIFDGMLLQLRSDFVDGVEIYTVTVESSLSTNIQPLVKRTRLPSEAEHVFNLWQAGLQNTCRGFV